MNRIKEARKASGLSQKQVAISLGLAGPSVSNWESGKTQPSSENYKALAKLLNVTVDYLVGNEEQNVTTEKENATEVASRTEELMNDGISLLAQMDNEQREKAIEYLEFIIAKRK